MSPQAFEGVCANQEREVGKRFHKFFVVLSAINHHFGDTQPKSGICRRADGNPVVGFGGGGAVFRSNDHNLSAALHALDEPMGIGQLVFYEVLSIHNNQLGRTQIIEVAVRGL